MTPPSSSESSSGEVSFERSSEWGLLLLTGTALLSCLFVVSTPSLPPPAADSPLPACPVPTNCVRTARSYAVPARTLYGAARRALEALGPVSLRRAPDSLRASAVYRVGPGFKDDVTVVVTSTDGTSTLHVRSASRVGLYDFEVNRRRVENLLAAVRELLRREQGQLPTN